MRILVTGVKGQLGHDVVNEMVKRGLEPVGVDLEEMDITDAGACRRVITESKVDAVIHLSLIHIYRRIGRRTGSFPGSGRSSR